MRGNVISKIYDLEDRTRIFATAVHAYARRISYHTATSRVLAQLIDAAGSVGANYVEANEALSKKDFAYRMKISRKEAKEARYWLAVMQPAGEEEQTRKELYQEATELLKILSSIINKAV